MATCPGVYIQELSGPVHAVAVVATLLDNELFVHKRGAFSGAQCSVDANSITLTRAQLSLMRSLT
jgi:hypothetical protein